MFVVYSLRLPIFKNNFVWVLDKCVVLISTIVFFLVVSSGLTVINCVLFVTILCESFRFFFLTSWITLIWNLRRLQTDTAFWISRNACLFSVYIRLDFIENCEDRLRFLFCCQQLCKYSSLQRNRIDKICFNGKCSKNTEHQCFTILSKNVR